MIWQLLRREPRWLLVAGVVGALIWAVEVPVPDTVSVMAIMIPGMMLLGSGMGRRATLFDAALPIPGPSLFTARLLFSLAVVWAPILTLMAFAPVAEPLAEGAIFSLAAVFCLTGRVEEFAVSTTRATVIASIAMILGMAEAWGEHAIAFALVCGAVAAARLIFVWPWVPAGYQAAPIEPRPARDAARRMAPLRVLTVLPLLRSAFPSMVLVMLGVIALQGFIGGWTFGVIAGIGVPGMARRASRWIWGLPVSRRALLAIAVLPYLLSMAGGFSLGAWLRPFGRRPVYPVALYDDSPTAPECWRFALGSSAPVTVAPWGESAVPRVSHAIPGIVVYNPFAARRDNSKRFIEWQFQRATQAIYGRPIPSEEFAKLDRRALRPLSLQFRGVVMSMGVVLCFALFGVFCFAAMEWSPFDRFSKPWRNAVTAIVMLLAFAPVVVINLAASLTTDALLTAFALRLSAALPPIAAAGIAGAAYAVVAWQFRGLEPSQQPAPVWAR